MNKIVQITLYILSILAVAAVIAAIIFCGGNRRTEETMSVSTEESAQGRQSENAESKDGASGESESENSISGKIEFENEDNVSNTSRTEAEVGGNTFNKQETEKISENQQDTTLIFTGDVLFANAFKAGYDANGISGVISAELLEELNNADILMINNEFPFSDRGEPMEDKQFTFRCSPSYVTALKEMGVDLVSLANNHTLDYGKEALSDTFVTLDEAGIRYGGAGESIERSQEIQIFEVNGKKFGFIAVSRVIPVGDWKAENSLPGLFSCYDETRLVELVAEAKEHCDFVAVYPHWGVEYQAEPVEYQTKIAQKCMEAGADIIVGSHTHCLQGVEFLEGKPVFYSLGNFVFGQSIDKSVAVKVTVAENGEASYQVIPVYAQGGVTRLAEGEEAERILRYLDEISESVTIGTDGTVRP